jgi:hypothetical protein
VTFRTLAVAAMIVLASCQLRLKLVEPAVAFGQLQAAASASTTAPLKKSLPALKRRSTGDAFG